jgi:chromosome segregation ATPase
MGLKELYENNPLVIIIGCCVLVLGLLGAIIGSTYAVLEKTQVSPRDREITILKELVTDLKKKFSELNVDYQTYRSQVEQLHTKLKILENDITVFQNHLRQYQDSIEFWKTQKSNLEKTLNNCTTNCSIISEVRNLDSRKSSLDRKLAQSGLVEEGNREEWKRQSYELQVRISDLQKYLVCQPN